MNVVFEDPPPVLRNHYPDKEQLHATMKELTEVCSQHRGRWIKVHYDDLYPLAKDIGEYNKHDRLHNLAWVIRRGNNNMFGGLFETTVRGLKLYIRKI